MKHLLIILIALFSGLKAQTYELVYALTVIEYPSERTLKDTGKLLVDTQSKEMLYTVAFGSQDVDNEVRNLNGGAMALPRTPYNYTLFTNAEQKFLIKDFIQGKYYELEDQANIHWKPSNETKMKNNIKLKKATADFRGRTYTAWYDDSAKFNANPWKFVGLKGIVYEVQDDNGRHTWELIKYEKTNASLKNPFDPAATMVSYRQYPKLRYALSEKLEKALSQNPNRTIFEQPRVDLEIKFEWE